MNDARYPESDKMRKASEHSQAIGEFLEWMESQGIRRMQWRTEITDWVPCVNVSLTGTHATCPNCSGSGMQEIRTSGYFDDGRSITKLLAEYFHVDLDKVEQERRAMLDEIRRHNAKPADDSDHPSVIRGAWA